MSNSSSIFSYQLISQSMTIYFGFFTLITGFFGGLLNILVFMTLKTFRSTPCVFYLTTASVVNVTQLLTSLLIRILSYGFYVDPTRVSWFCKLRMFTVQYSALISLTCMSLAIVDQFVSMKHERLSSLQLAHRHVFISCIIFLIHGIPFLLYFGSVNDVCQIVDSSFAKYVSFFYFPLLLGFLPLIIMITFASLAFFTSRTNANRNRHIEISSRNRQLSAMVLVQAIFIVLLTVPYLIVNIYALTVDSLQQDPVLHARNNMIQSVTILFYYESYATPFYVFYAVSRRFRKQVGYVLIDIHFKRFQQAANNLNNNQVVPNTEIN
ncbi:unnamed protein product [Adineta ricciae]|uniref:G-protein coupled receptors family 1 profile domain-containing protein n=2 Tax=Adineta ricciae TaxID=249248 RepID=A0A814NHS0_ADIRI|nr:unnamed protein product [Adineta ricciae]CAF1330648.1 unnamed protein product [Adineta ricciae]